MRAIRRFPLLPAILFALPLLTACEQVGELLELPNPKKEAAQADAEGRAIGSACRHAGRSLEDCYVLNPGAQKAAVFAGWRDMNDYMMEHKLDVVPSQLPQVPPQPKAAPAQAAEAPAAARAAQH
ncbi:hypothetical protein [Azoarcus olearius]|uniref:Conserved hypothetical secreted protein n=1 Tax=Azoarcus sp. (strain BH72) TaxID=418699 RepID=A1K473_AZOSB|nr:hypothetical protein [Azoarcus olearius]ANQ84176.1 hypothetical protein dqs_1112 [Azoarcus olearius]CAL93628.1 conserved hypothetical secreted protein [Azoarcus olearius]